MCRRATHITSRRVGALLAVTPAESLFKSPGLVSLTSEGSLGPAVAPWVNVPCDGESPASEIPGKANRETDTARPVAIKTATDTNNSRRISPPPRKPNRVGSHCNRIPEQKHQFIEEISKFLSKCLPSVTPARQGWRRERLGALSRERSQPAPVGLVVFFKPRSLWDAARRLPALARRASGLSRPYSR